MTGEDKQGLIIIFFVVLSLAMLFGIKHTMSVSANNIDPETLCRIGKEDSTVKILIDKTDPWDEHSQQRLASLIRSIKSHLVQYERLSVYILDETGTYSPSPVFDMCNPGRGDQANELYQNPRRVQQKFEEQFAAPLEMVLEPLILPGSAPRSPIIETIKGLRGNGEEQLVLVSDMMQNSEALSFYSQTYSNMDGGHNNICGMDKPYKSVHVYYVNRSDVLVAKKQGVRNFWDSCLDGIAWQAEWKSL